MASTSKGDSPETRRAALKPNTPEAILMVADAHTCQRRLLPELQEDLESACRVFATLPAHIVRFTEREVAPGRLGRCCWASLGPRIPEGLVQVQYAPAFEADMPAQKVEQATQALPPKMNGFPQPDPAALRRDMHLTVFQI